MVTTIYSEHEWFPWKFDRVPYGYWLDMGNQRKYMDWVANQLNYKEKDDWYKITVEVFK